MSVFVKQKGYSRMEKEDPDEKRHRKAQFLIYKIMENASNGNKRRPSWLGIRIRKLKFRIGRRLKKMNKALSLSLSIARIGICHQFGQLRTCNSLFGKPKAQNLAFPSLVA